MDKEGLTREEIHTIINENLENVAVSQFGDVAYRGSDGHIHIITPAPRPEWQKDIASISGQEYWTEFDEDLRKYIASIADKDAEKKEE